MKTYFFYIVWVVLSVVSFLQESKAETRTRADVMFNSPNASERKNLVATLVSKIVKSDPKYASAPKDELLLMSPLLTSDDFSPESRAILEQEFHNNKKDNLLMKEDILLAGMAGVDSIEEEVKKYAEGPINKPYSGLNKRFLWAANMVLARRGDRESIWKILQASRQADIHDQVVLLLGELAYVSQPEVAEYIANFVFSEERLEPEKQTVLGSLYGEYAAAALSRMLVGCPVPYKESYGYSYEEIKTLREWLMTKKLNHSWEFRSHGR